MPTRRDTIRAAGAVLAGSAVLTGTATTPASADHEHGDWRAKPDGVTIEYDETWLKQYEPQLVTERTTREKIIGVYGYAVRNDPTATQQPYDYDVACYWMQATHQNGLDLIGLFEADSHLGDHEPIYVYVEPDTGKVDRVVYSTYHHFPGEVTPDTATFVQDRHPDHATHPVFRVVSEWHNYSAIQDDQSGAYLGLDDWVGVRDSWADHGFYMETADEAIEDPATMRTRHAWWAKGTFDYQVGRLFHDAGLRGAGQSDPIR